ncbi:hypothetical protein PP175_28945 (plasmid) [Aneurinibacillus sp. Ricciae_BoGa-3]|uniref:hypothetical protein n=1 Tax=Aneurinibacillus sp. Ricciae_BoGa-3 TaxID=3022697 RepID=UPI00233F9768|nr:hypothetical protein [Aneurinibacillus sp. Ricciae_BoGa-3]WCK57219.1 hypothetical protein PP175_28945 [Aneurinibacillus sp. Ricciae_BoGa-3]
MDVTGMMKQALKEMFQNQEIKIVVDQRDFQDSRYLVVKVSIDEEEIYQHEEYIGFKQ